MSNKFNSESIIIKIIITLLLLLALLNMPYWYYQLLKVILFVAFGYLAFIEFRNDVSLFPFIFLVFALVFSPIFNLKLGREGWNVVDIIAALVLVYSILDSKYFRRFYG